MPDRGTATPTSPHVSGCPATPWWTGCIGCERICGGRRRRSGPGRAGGERAGALGLRLSTAEAAGKTAVGVMARTANPKPGTGQVGGGTVVWAGRSETPAVESEVSVTATGQLSCSCPIQKSKNFVFRARTTSLRSVVLPARVGKNSWAFLLQAGDYTVEQYLLLKERVKNKKSPPREGRYRSCWAGIPRLAQLSKSLRRRL